MGYTEGADGTAGEAGGNPAQYPLLYWRSGIPLKIAAKQVFRKGFQVTVGIILWEGGNIVKIPKSEHPLLNGAL